MRQPKTTRFAISLDNDLLRDFDRFRERQGYDNRSKAVRDLIHGHLIEQKWNEGENVVGTITLVYNHYQMNSSADLIPVQDDYRAEIITKMQVHVDPENYLEVIVAKGKGKRIRELANRLISAKGVKHGKLTLTAAGEELK